MGKARLKKWMRTLSYTLALLGLVVIVLAAFNLLLQKGQGDEPLVDVTVQSRAPTDLLVERFQRRLMNRPEDQKAYVQLGGAYLQKAREMGDLSYYLRAEEALRKALELEPSSVSAMNLMGALAMGGHQFQEALEWAERSLKLDPRNANAYGILGDAQTELGQYEAAFGNYQTMVDLKPDLSSYARVAYARERMGDVEGAIEAMQMAVAAGPAKGEATAWALVQLGNLYFNIGRLDEAAEHYESALRAFDSHYLALAGLGKTRAAQTRYDEAIKLYEQAVAIIPQPVILAALGDLYARTGNVDQAKLQYDTVEFIARLAAINQVVYNRDLALFYADHDLKLDEALDLARRELAVRKDIYGYDALAWALYKNDRLEKAAESITEALKLGTQDPNLYYHAGMIYYSLGQHQQARDYLERALTLNPSFSILYSDDARRTLAELDREAALSGNQEGPALGLAKGVAR